MKAQFEKELNLLPILASDKSPCIYWVDIPLNLLGNEKCPLKFSVSMKNGKFRVILRNLKWKQVHTTYDQTLPSIADVIKEYIRVSKTP